MWYCHGLKGSCLGNFAVRSAWYATYQFMKSSAASKYPCFESFWGGGAIVGRLTFPWYRLLRRRETKATMTRHWVLVRLGFFVFRGRSLAHVISSCWKLYVAHVVWRSVTNSDDDISKWSSSSEFGGVVRFRRTISAAMENVTSSWLCLSRNVDSFIVLRIDFINIENFNFRFDRNWSWFFFKKAKDFDINLVKFCALQNMALGLKFYLFIYLLLPDI